MGQSEVRMTLRIYAVVLELIRELKPILDKIMAKDSNLGDQMKRAMTSVPLNTHEGAYSQGRLARARFCNALASAGEIRGCLDTAVVMDYIEPVDPKVLDKLDHVIATFSKLTRR